MYSQTVLTALLVWPVVAAAVVLLVPERWAKHVALAASLAEFAISVPLWWTFQPAAGMQFVLDLPWIPFWGIRYTVGVDGISLFMLVAILALVALIGQRSGIYSFSYTYLLAHLGGLGPAAFWLFGAFFLAFAIKVPMFPFHTWLPDAHVEAPTAGSVILAGVLLKMGTYGFVRFALPFFPDVVMHPKVRGWMIALSIIGIIYGALVSLMQKDMKKLVAYSSVSHLGFCTLGIFALNPAGLSGSVLQQINHGISTGALFLIVGILYERRHTREISEYGGISNVSPVYATITMIMFLSSMGLPFLNGFVGEFTILQGTFMET